MRLSKRLTLGLPAHIGKPLAALLIGAAAHQPAEMSAQAFAPTSYHLEFGVSARGSNRAAHPNMHAFDDDCYCCFEDVGNDARVRATHIGFKPEFVLFPILSVDAGVRLTYTNAHLAPDHTIYWRFIEHGQRTEYVTLERLRQEALYVGIPVELRLMPRGEARSLLYFKVGGCANVRVHHNNMAYTMRERMRWARKAVESQMGTPDRFAFPLWGAIGFQFGTTRQLCLELTLPYLTHFAQYSSIVSTRGSGIGLQFTYRLHNWAREI